MVDGKRFDFSQIIKWDKENLSIRKNTSMDMRHVELIDGNHVMELDINTTDISLINPVRFCIFWTGFEA